jgi:hypothetical protein
MNLRGYDRKMAARSPSADRTSVHGIVTICLYTGQVIAIDRQLRMYQRGAVTWARPGAILGGFSVFSPHNRPFTVFGAVLTKPQSRRDQGAI